MQPLPLQQLLMFLQLNQEESASETKPEDLKAKDKEDFSDSKTTNGEATSTHPSTVPAVLPFQAGPGSVKGVSPNDWILLAEIIFLCYDLFQQSSSRHFGLPNSKSQC
ncbi:hypothetical protein MJO29_012097 [Puccinia striiformis f. sp. tritici]|nr:hypothetical protein MJO29_012097 [Puccinia striiformis f. sp. tritici]